MRTLFAGPWIGELGWELFGWQSYIRVFAEHFDRVVVCSRTGHDVLYQDFCHEFLAHDPPQTETSGHLLVGYRYEDLHRRYVKEEGDIWIPPTSFGPGLQEFALYGRPSESLRYDVILHARFTSKVDSGSRNWPLERWHELVLRLKQRGYRLACVGSSDASAAIEGTDDLRGIPMRQLVDVLASSRLMIGPSSGPMHLASLCRCPHLVWTDDQYQIPIEGTNRDRYERLWNPLRTAVQVVDDHGWRPPVAVIDARIEAFLEQLEREGQPPLPTGAPA